MTTLCCDAELGLTRLPDGHLLRDVVEADPLSIGSTVAVAQSSGQLLLRGDGSALSCRPRQVSNPLKELP